jgi:hypothetical protein
MIYLEGHCSLTRRVDPARRFNVGHVDQDESLVPPYSRGSVSDELFVALSAICNVTEYLGQY